jgi:hypothetical protein
LSRAGSKVNGECTFGASDKRATVGEWDDEESNDDECSEEDTVALTSTISSFFFTSLICLNSLLQLLISVERSDPDLPNFSRAKDPWQFRSSKTFEPFLPMI